MFGCTKRFFEHPVKLLCPVGRKSSSKHLRSSHFVPVRASIPYLMCTNNWIFTLLGYNVCTIKDNYIIRHGRGLEMLLSGLLRTSSIVWMHTKPNGLVEEALGFQKITLKSPSLLPFVQQPHTKFTVCEQSPRVLTCDGTATV